MPSDKAVGFPAAGASPCLSMSNINSITLHPNVEAAEALAAPLCTSSTSPRESRTKQHSFSHRIGFALASTGAKMAVVPALGSALRRLHLRRSGPGKASRPSSARSVAIQTSPDISRRPSSTRDGVSMKPDPLQSAATFANAVLRAQRSKAREDLCCPLKLPKSLAVSNLAEPAPLASAESLFDSELSVCRRKVPQIREQTASSDHELDCEASRPTAGGVEPGPDCLLNIPPSGLSRKSSTGDSAVDLKFSEDDRSAASPGSALPAGDDMLFRVRGPEMEDSRVEKGTLQNHLAAMMRLLDDEAVRTPSSRRKRLRRGEQADGENGALAAPSCAAFAPTWPRTAASFVREGKLANSNDERFSAGSSRALRGVKSMGHKVDNEHIPRRPFQRSWSTSSWRKLRNVVIWTPFMQQYKRHKYPWIQLAGHEDNFHPGEQGSVLKKFTERESMCLQALSKDVLRSFVPEFRGIVEKHGEKYIRMQDLLVELDTPSLMDCKLGTRTYLEEELCKAKLHPPRKDMYEKMIAIDSSAPTPEEHTSQAIYKPRYMQWRESMSSTSNLGFRIEGIKKSIGTSSRDYKRTKQRDDVKECLRDFTDCNLRLLNGYLNSLYALVSTLDVSQFFQNHEVIGSSLLFIHDRCGHARVWLIDFGKTVSLPAGIRIDHRSPWVEGNHEDGALFGLDNLISLLTEIRDETRPGETSA